MHKDWALRNSEHCGTFNEEVNSSLCTKDTRNHLGNFDTEIHPILQ